MVGTISALLSSVYFFEYAVSVGFAALANPNSQHSSWFRKNSYEVLAVCYQIGVLISRSSISVVQIRYI